MTIVIEDIAIEYGSLLILFLCKLDTYSVFDVELWNSKSYILVLDFNTLKYKIYSVLLLDREYPL